MKPAKASAKIKRTAKAKPAKAAKRVKVKTRT